MLRHAREGPARCRTRETAPIFPGAVLGLGHYNPTGPHAATVNGNIVAKQPLTLYLGAITVHGNVVSNGGGDPTRNFPIKDDTVGGNLILQGWHGLWLGAIRDTGRWKPDRLEQHGG